MSYILANLESIVTAVTVLWTAYLSVTKEAKPKNKKGGK